MGKKANKLILEEAEKMLWYHTIELSSDFTTKGVYDWRPYWQKFDFGDLRGKTVLDVGAGDGFFSFEFEKKGATVTALDIPHQGNRDSAVYGLPEKEGDKNCKNYNNVNTFAMFKEKFEIAKKALNSQVERVEIDLYDISGEEIGLFDIVFCSDVLLHLTDPVKALRRLRAVCKHVTIICTPVLSTSGFGLNFMKRIALLILKNDVLSQFMGVKSRGGGSFWVPTNKCLSDMVICSGFRKERLVSNFIFRKEDTLTFGEAKACRMERAVIHGYV